MKNQHRMSLLRGTEVLKSSSVEGEREIIMDEIRHRAYELFGEHGCIDGRDLDDWLQAEKEVLQARKRVA